MKDYEIVELYWNRSEKAIDETIKQYHHYCNRISFNVLGNISDVEECLNEVWTSAWNSIPPNKPEDLKSYLGKIARDISISRWRKNHAAKRYQGEFNTTLEEIEEIAVDDDLNAKFDEMQLSQAISDFLRTLPETERNLMIRRYWYNDSIQSLCKRYSFGESKVKVTLKRLRDKLAIYLRKEGYTL